MPYLGEQYVKHARAFRIWPFPRGHYKHMTVIPHKGSTFLLADQRLSPLLPSAMRRFASPGLQALAGKTSQDCNAVCGYAFPIGPKMLVLPGMHLKG